MTPEQMGAAWQSTPCNCVDCTDRRNDVMTAAVLMEIADADHTPDNEPRMPGMPKRCRADGEHWPCAWEQRRAYLAAALRVVEAARACFAADSGTGADARLFDAVCIFDDWEAARDAQEREHAPREGGS